MSDMTREIALYCMKAYSELHSEVCEECEIYGQTGCDHCFEDALQVAIASLEIDESYQLEYESTTKNDLGVDAVSRKAVLNKILKFSVTDGRSVSVTGLWTEVNELPPATPQEPFINKPCVSEKVCEHDKQMVLNKIRAEIEKDAFDDVNGSKFIFVNRVNQIIDKYKAEVKPQESEDNK